MKPAAPAGAVVSLHVDLVAEVSVGEVIQTSSGRRYRVLTVRRQESGKHEGRQHLRCIVMAPEDSDEGRGLHRIHWYPRIKSKRRSR